jgi:hypothetical protein
MAKNKKKDKKAKKQGSSDSGSLQNVIQKLREENEILRGRLEKIAELTRGLPGDVDQDEEDEYDELTRDVDDQIADGQARVTPDDGT